MPKVTFVTDQITVTVRKGSRLPNIVDHSDATLSFGCRQGSCGTCRCIVEKGISHVNPLTKNERELFRSLTSVEKHERLGCQLKILGDVWIKH